MTKPKHVLIGSRAYQAWFPDYPLKADTDWDIISEAPEEFLGLSGSRIEIHKPDEYLSGVFADRFTSTLSVEIAGISVQVMNLRGISCIKRSHLALDWQWEKHIGFWHRHLKLHWNPEDWHLMKAREKITLEKALQRNPKLLQGNDEFFQDAVKKVVPHDHPEKSEHNGARVVVCPAQTRNVTCDDCRLCALPGSRKVLTDDGREATQRRPIIAFRVHGSQHKKAAQALKLADLQPAQ